jgi:tetratricopeptide (TPR) repeat protein
VNADPNTLFNYAFSAHQAGNVKEAISMYQQLLVQLPDEPQILTALGTAWFQLESYSEGVKMLERSIDIFPNQVHALSNIAFGLHKLSRFDEAITFCDRAIALAPDFSAAHNNKANSLNKVKRFDEALASCDSAIDLDPNSADVHHIRGNILNEMGSFDKALENYDRAIFLNSNFIDAYFSRSNLLNELKRFEEALIGYDHLLSLKPDFVDAYCNRGDVLRGLKRPEEALKSYEKAILFKPDCIEAHNNRSVVLNELKCFEQVIECCDYLIALKPDLAEAYSNKGNALNELNRLDEALMSHDYAISLKSDFAEGYVNRGNVLSALRRFDKALENYNQAILLKSDLIEAYCNRGVAFKELNCFEKALQDYDYVIAMKPECAESYWNKALIKLTLGEFIEGWKLCEWRWKCEQIKKNRAFEQPLWLGDASISGKTILIYPEQGLGDIIQMCRYVPMLNALGAKVVLEVPVSLVSVVSTLKSDLDIVKKGATLPNFDVQCPIMSLPLALKTTVDTIPAEIPYLFSNPAKQKVWKERLGTKTKPRIGFVCSGSTTHNDDSKRSIPLDLLKPLFELPHEFHMLQKEIRSDDQKVLELFPHIQIYQEYLVDFSDTAALIEEMDLVVSVDTSVVHLAGALGKPVWVLISWAPDFRWLLDRTDNPWYPTATLFRQPERGNWEHVIEDICQKLKGQYVL